MEDSKRKKGKKEIENNQKTIRKMEMISPYISIITLSINGLNFPIKR